MSKNKDNDWVPSKAVKNWARRYAVKRYQRNRQGRLLKEDNLSENTENIDIEKLSGAQSLEIANETIFSLSTPLSRTQSLEGVESLFELDAEKSVKSVNKSKSCENLVQPKTAKMSLEDLLARLSTSVTSAVTDAQRNDHKTLPPLPYFSGEAPKPQGYSGKEPWQLYNCEDFLNMIENAISTDRWSEPGKLRSLQDKLLGIARIYWEDRGPDINTFAKAKEYMLNRFPNTDTFNTLNRQIIEFRRKPGELIPGMACRIQNLYNKIGKVAPEMKAAQKRNMKELFLNNLPEVVRDNVEEADDFNKTIEKSVAYVERHKELKLRAQDIQLETTFKTEAKINNVNVQNKGQEEQGKKKNSKPGNQNYQNKNAQKPNDQATINNMNHNNYNQNYNQRLNRSHGNVFRGDRGQHRSNFRGRNQYRGQNFRGNFRGNYRGQENSFRGYRSNFRGRGYRSNFRNNYRSNFRSNFRGNPSAYRNHTPYNQSYNSARDLTCNNCGRTGHMQRTCNYRSPNYNNRNETVNNQNQGNNSCWHCGSTTHYARTCPQKN